MTLLMAKTPPPAPRRAGLQLTPRDVAIATDLTRYGVLAAPTIKRRHFPDTAGLYATWQRLRELKAAGYVSRQVLGYHQEAAYLPTGKAVTLSGLALPVPRCYPEFLTAVWHHMSVAELADWLLEQLPGSSWTTEREERLNRRVGEKAIGVDSLVDALPGKLPDGVLTAGGKRLAVELELRQKADRAYSIIAGRYARRLEAGVYSRVQWFCAADAIQAAVERAIERAGDPKRMWVRDVPEGVTVYGRRP